MKKMNLILAGTFLAIGFSACSDSGTSNTATTTDSTSTTTATNNTATDTNTATTTSTANRTPFDTQDSTFVMKAAMGGMMEVEAGNIAQQNASHDRVKAFGSMMVNDHGKANSELIALAAGRGITLPTALPPDMQKHMDEMRKMKGKAFDDHYMSMMVDDHKKDITLFEKQSTGGTDAELKAWAAKTLPVLQMHRDSATAINKAIK
jgi:putative membrane protein